MWISIIFLLSLVAMPTYAETFDECTQTCWEDYGDCSADCSGDLGCQGECVKTKKSCLKTCEDNDAAINAKKDKKDNMAQKYRNKHLLTGGRPVIFKNADEIAPSKILLKPDSYIGSCGGCAIGPRSSGVCCSGAARPVCEGADCSCWKASTCEAIEKRKDKSVSTQQVVAHPIHEISCPERGPRDPLCDLSDILNPKVICDSTPSGPKNCHPVEVPPRESEPAKPPRKPPVSSPRQLPIQCLTKKSPSANIGDYAVEVTNNCGVCVDVTWNVFVNGERWLRYPGDSTETNWQPRVKKNYSWTMNKYGTWEWRATSVKQCL